MEHLKRTPIIILLCLLSFFSCKPTDVISPKDLNAVELETAVQSMSEFHLYQQATSDANEELLLKLKNLDKKDAKWVELVHEKYPTVEDFIQHAESLELATYQALTGLNLLDGNQDVNTHFRNFISELQLSANYKIEDLVEIVFPDIQKESVEKFFPSCASYCTYEAGRQQRKIYALCIQNSSIYPASAYMCGQKAEIAFRYYLAKCIKSCSGF